MTVINAELLKKLRTEMDEALKAVAKANGVLIKTGNASYKATSATFKVEIVAIGEDDNSEELTNQDATKIKAAADWKSQAILFGMKTEWLGKSANTFNGKVEIVGLMPRRRKFPVLVNTQSGLKLMTTEQISRAFATVV